MPLAWALVWCIVNQRLATQHSLAAGAGVHNGDALLGVLHIPGQLLNLQPPHIVRYYYVQATVGSCKP